MVELKSEEHAKQSFKLMVTDGKLETGLGIN